ncbi:bifunctional protein GlmU [Actinotalea ferrariae CF5-4]|uniref:Bifunctional protein GlmU n=1 Tax=Actinotalea ferrariae CF5-4 TaxID=948458 RepID=A0A021VQH7_9CELL|nr:DUF2892 domain-containing protein [Actinotalea ferrariae]EYR63386.1 bifunctional protein GlmU [Actinotalea ferrariae CF5-4]
MKQNLSSTDRAVRAFLVAPALVVVGVLVGPAAALSWVAYALAAIMVLSSAVGWCPLYALVGVSTCPRVADRVDARVSAP